MIPFLHGVFATSGGVASDFELIETQTVGAGGAASVTFSSIPSTYKHLQLRFIAKESGGSSAYTGGLALTFNSSTGNEYTYHQLIGNGSAASSYGDSSLRPAANTYAGSSQFGCGIVDILDYASSSKYKTLRHLSGADANGSGIVSLASSVWLSTSAVSSLKVALTTLQQYSTFSLYGVK